MLCQSPLEASVEDGIIAHLYIALHQVGKHPGHATVGNKIRDYRHVVICMFHDTAKEDFLIGKRNVGTAGRSPLSRL
jgi:hypothetical protein